jgi:hypothetical protein
VTDTPSTREGDRRRVRATRTVYASTSNSRMQRGPLASAVTECELWRCVRPHIGRSAPDSRHERTSRDEAAVDAGHLGEDPRIGRTTDGQRLALPDRTP